MRVIKPYIKDIIFHIPEGTTIEKWIESAGRTCYKSEDLITDDSAIKFIERLISRGHLAMLEHAVISAIIIADRGLTHELVRHRIASYAQESTRYCNYSKEKFGSEIIFIEPPGLNEEQYYEWYKLVQQAEDAYLNLIDLKCKPEIARGVLPISLKTEIVITANLREWLHIFELRTAPAAHPMIRNICKALEKEFGKRLPVIFNRQPE